MTSISNNPAGWTGNPDSWEAQFARFLKQQMPPDDSAHDITHIQRVVANAHQLAAAEGAELDVVIPAAWLHDCVVMPKNSATRSRASRLAAETASVYLHEAGYPADLIPAIHHAIEAHSFSANITPRTLEAQVVQDADRLDALGAIGIARCFMVGGALGKPLYDEAEPLPETRQPDDNRFVIDHFYVKLFKLVASMNTASGRQTAERRTQVMVDYLAQLEREIEGLDEPLVL